MSSEREKLIEIWLDSANERQYQFAFRNALLYAGSTIIHNTSHTALELGKDLLVINPAGQLLAYQLKGNPGGRLTISQWQAMIPQINALVYHPVSHPNVKPGTVHIPVLVTNGEIHEDVFAAIAAYNAQLAATLPRARPLETISRGELLKLILDSADTLWPVDVPAQRNILNVFAAPGDDEIPMQEYIAILDGILNDKYSEAAIPAAHLVTTILASNWIKHDNYFELIKMYVLLAVSSACYQARWKRVRRGDMKFIDEIVFDVRTCLLSFVRGLAFNYADRRPLLNRSIFEEFSYYHPRKKMTSGLASIVLLDKEIEIDDGLRDFLRDFVCLRKHAQFLVWEGIIPYCLAEFWALCNIQGTKEPDRRLFALINDILKSNGNEDSELNQLPGPYYSLCEVIQWKYKFLLQNFRSEIDRDSHYRRSWFAEPLFLLLVRRNYKSACKLLWPDLTKFTHERTQLPNAIAFGPARCDAAVSEDKIINISSQWTWDDVVRESAVSRLPTIPSQLLAKPVLVLLYCLFVPQRMNLEIILWLDRIFARSWY